MWYGGKILAKLTRAYVFKRYRLAPASSIFGGC